MSTRAARGREAEDRVRTHLEAQGLRLKARNHRCRWGEIDLVMEDGEALVFVEVRYRGRDDYGSAAASVDAHKQRRLVRAASDFLARHQATGRPARFDVAAVGPNGQIDWIRAAFDTE